METKQGWYKENKKKKKKRKTEKYDERRNRLFNTKVLVKYWYKQELVFPIQA